MGHSREAVGAFLLVLGFASCGSDDKKRAVRAEAGAGGEAGETAPSSGGSQSRAGAPSSEGGTPAHGDGGAPGGSTQSSGTGPEAGSGPTPGDGGAPTGTPITIHGIVVARNEAPVPGVTVRVQGKSMVTGTDGTFELDATAPYDIVVHGGVYGQENTEAYLGVTRADPKLYRSFVDGERSGDVSGVLSGGGGFPVAANHKVYLSFAGPVLATFSNLLQPGASANYDSSGAPTWLGTDSLAGFLYAIEVDGTNGAILATGSKPVTLLHNDTVGSPDGDVVLSAAQLKDFAVTLNKPADVTLSQFIVSVGGHIIQQALPTGDVSVQVPSNLPDEVTLNVVTYGAANGNHLQSTYRLAGSANAANLGWTTAPVIATPADATTLGANGAFTYTKPAQAVAVLSFSYSQLDPQTEAENSFYTDVYTDGSSVSLSRLLGLGLDLPAFETLTFSVTSDALEPNVDALVAPEVRRFDTIVTAGTPVRYFNHDQGVQLPP
jgi:hypothetical protein